MHSQRCNVIPQPGGGDGVLWRGRQWAVTTFGVECLTRRYEIDRDRIFELLGENYCWLDHMSRKRWVDLTDFAEALKRARHLFRRHRRG